jgi:hypothetical protein
VCSVSEFAAWCESRGLHELAGIELVHVAAYGEQLQQRVSAPSVRPHLTALRVSLVYKFTIASRYLHSNARLTGTRLNPRLTGSSMRQLSPAGQQVIDDIAQRHGFSVNATVSMLDSVINGNGTMAQFSHPEFAGSGQWMRGGMTMVSDMFNSHLKARVDSLCAELSNVIASQPELIRSGSFQSQRQGNGHVKGQEQVSHLGGQQQNDSGSGSGFSPASLFEPPAAGASGDWWPADLRWPNSTGAQNGVRYAYFAQACRLLIEVNGGVTVYDTLDHHIGGFSQQQSYGSTLSFKSQYGLIDSTSLPVIPINVSVRTQ